MSTIRVARLVLARILASPPDAVKPVGRSIAAPIRAGFPGQFAPPDGPAEALSTRFPEFVARKLRPLL
jgi:hypothetical protein